ncbi:TPA: hypothetical protein EYP44_02965 [Candidatus Bathyarchaeota archaeon]|nr:hypothetical protein [Candidatus Bathyarchaeota archaeon]
MGEARCRFKQFGWQGLCFEIPEDWRFTVEGGNIRSGYLRLEAEGLCLELRWERIRRRPKPLSTIADELVKQLEKSKKVKKVIVRKRGKTRIFRHDALFVHLKSDVAAWVFLWYCNESNRFVTCQFSSKAVARHPNLIRKQVLKSLRCHGFSRNIWSVIGFYFETPTSFELKERKLAVGRTSLLFSREERSTFAEQRSEILFECFSLANVRFEKLYESPGKWMEEYYLKELRKRYRKLKLRASRSTRIRTHKVAVKKGSAGSGIIWRKTASFIVASWYCPDMNRMYAVTVSDQIKRPIIRCSVGEDFVDIFKDFFSSVNCHQASPA